MSTEVLISIITGACSILGVIITTTASSNKLSNKIQTEQAVTNTKLEQLTEEVRSHNDFARRIPVLEEQIKVINHRLEDLEKKIED